MTSELWPKPRQRDVDTFSDLTLYVDALTLAKERDGINAVLLKEELRPRLSAFRFVREQSLSVARKLVEELQLFGWLEASDTLSPRPGTRARLTSEGEAALTLAREDPTAFRRLLVERMHAVCTVPGWFVQRLWTINPAQGEVILPAPVAVWSPSEETRRARRWTEELRGQTLRSAALARSTALQAFPVGDEAWHDAVRAAWERLRDRKRRLARAERDPITGTRSGLTLAMRAAGLSLLFGSVPFGRSDRDFASDRPLTPKTFKPWCRRLQALELIGYTDCHPAVVGRLLYPTSLFRVIGEAGRFEEIPGIRSPDGKSLFLHQPHWEGCREGFWRTLVGAYHDTFRRVQARYVSLLDVRDEVCRRLRLSPTRFDFFLEQALEEVPSEGGWHLSVETDMREDLRTGRGLARRPVYVRGDPHTLLAVACLPRVPRSAS